MLWPVLATLRSAAETAEVLVVSSGGPFGGLFAREFSGRNLTITPGMLTSELYRQVFHSAPNLTGVCATWRSTIWPIFEICSERPVFFESSQPNHSLRDNLAGRALDEWTFEFTRELFPLIGGARISFTGSYMSALLIRWFASRLTRHNLARLGSNLAFAATLAICAPLARFASRIEERQNPHRFRAHCTSMTIEIDLP
jgi:hypothetical protein